MLASASRLATLRCQHCGQHSRHCQCLYDVRDPSAFVHGTINAWSRPNAKRGPIVLTADEHEELHQEGLAILYRLSEIFEPHRAGYEQAGRFSGFAAQMLPRKLGDAWHRLHAGEHRHEPGADGKRRWVYGEKAVSLEALTADDPDRHPVMADRASDGNLAGRIRAALLERSAVERDFVVGVGLLTGKGEQAPAIAARLGLDEGTVRRYWRQLVRSLPEPRHQFTSAADMREHLERVAESDAEKASRVGELLGEGASAADIAQIMGIELGEVHDHEEAIRQVLHRIESQGDGE